MSLTKPSSCSACPLFDGPYGTKYGYVPAHGTGDNGVLIILEAGGEHEAAAGIPVVGPTGQYMFSQLKRIGIDREGFRIHNVLSCQPPKNKLIKQPYTEAAILHCAPNLDATIYAHTAHCKEIGKTPVILALGKFSARRVMGWWEHHPIMKEEYYTYPFWNEKYQCWVINAPHPSHIMQGNHHLAHLLQFCAKRAVIIAEEGLELENPPYLLDPDYRTFSRWVDEFLIEQKKNPTTTFLSYDIETPYKSGKSEADIGKEENDDYTILRVSFCYKPGNAVSVRWSPEYMPSIERLFMSGAYGLNWNGETYDNPRIINYISKFNLISLDGMLAWHVLHTSMDKGLGFVTPFYWQNCGMWKHLSDSEPARYNAIDADAALRNWLGILPALKEYNLYEVFERHVLKLNEVLRYMTGHGIPLDLEARKNGEERLSILQEQIKKQIDSVVPAAARVFDPYLKVPKDTTGMVQIDGLRNTKKCENCGEIDVLTSHFKSVGKKKLSTCKQCNGSIKKHCGLDEPGLDHEEGCELYHHEFKGEPENKCHGFKSIKLAVPDKLWAVPLEFKLSTKSLSRYQQVVKHKPIINRKESKVTFDEEAIKDLRKKYPNDPLYPTIVDFRETQTLLSRYIGRTQEDGSIKGGLKAGKDGRIRCTYTHNPSTLRLASQSPNMQNLQRPDPKNPDALGNIVRNLIVASPGWMLGARDFSGIEAVLVGYEAQSKDYTRLALRDVHSFYTAYALHEIEGRIPANDLPLLSWDDDKLFTRLGEIKKEFKKDRNNLYKHLVHAINFGQGAYGARDKIYAETNIVYDTKLISRLMDIYHELFPHIGKWQRDIRLRAHDDGFLTNAFGYLHRFNHVFRYVKDKWTGEMEKKPGDDAEAVLAFKPQSTAAGIIKEAMLRLYFERFNEAGQYMRLTTHDEILWECPPELMTEVDTVFVEEMERPIPQLPLPESWGMGTHLHILTEGKYGERWGDMS